MKHISSLKQTYYCTLLLSVAKSAGSGRSTAIFFNRSYCDSSHSKMSSGKFKRFSDWSFDAESQLEKFPIDPVKENFVRRLVRNAVFSRVNPTPLETELKLVAASDDVLEKVMDLEPEEARLQCFAEFVAGNVLAKNSKPMAHRYGGHQFGYWADQLGDGRAHILGEYTNRDGKRWELQLKGSGKTPYSRGGDGRAVLRSSVREFLCSEAMNALGIPTSRAAALVVSNDPVIRDRFYNGKIEVERAAVVLRIAPSWFRIGSLEICTKYKETEILRQITDFAIDNYYPNINGPAKYLDFFKKVFSESVSLVAKWMSVGFAHGVLNTDNLSLLSITIDYGPFGFLDEYNPYFIPNSSDDEGRYSYVNQPAIFEWNLWQLANALSPLLTEAEKQEIETVLGSFDSVYEEHFLENMSKKLGFTEPFEKRKLLVDSLLDMMESLRSDFTQTFRQLGKVSLDAEDFSDQWAIEPLAKHRSFADFINLYKSCLEDQGISEDTRRTRMNQANPQYVLRNWMAEAAIREANQDSFELTRLLLKILTDPYHEDSEAEELGFSRKPPTWSKCLKVSCSS